jgi:hypothetical protein
MILGNGRKVKELSGQTRGFGRLLAVFRRYSLGILTASRRAIRKRHSP